MNTQMYTTDIESILNKCWNMEDIIPKDNIIKEGSSYALTKFQKILKTHQYRRKMKQPESLFYKESVKSKKCNTLDDFYSDENNDINYIKWKHLDYFFKKKYLEEFCDRQRKENNLNDSKYNELKDMLIKNLENKNLLKPKSLIYNYRKKKIIKILMLK